MMKKLATVLLVLVVVAGAGIWYLYSNLDHYIKVAIEKYGTAATQTDVGVGSVHLSITQGEGSIGGLSVANPKGFSSNKAFDLGSITVKVDPSSVTGTGPIIVTSVDIEQPQVSFELDNNGSTNLQTIQKNAQNYAASMSGTSGKKSAAPTDASAGDKAQRKIIINDLTIHNGQVSVSQEMMKDKKFSAPLPTIHLTDIGKNSGGATAGQVAQQLISAVSNEAAKVGLTELAKQKINGTLGAVPGSAIGGAAIDAVGSQVKDLFGQ